MIAFGVAAVVALGAIIALSIGGGDGDSATATPNAGDNVSALPIELFDGSVVTLGDYAGKPLLLNFWASWCVPCLKEMPGFETVYQSRQDQISFLGVNLQDREADALAVIDQTGVTYPLARDRDGSLFTELGGFGMPTTLFIDSDGTVIEMVTGEISAGVLDGKIAKIVDS
jgi:cytochrome c biogenesis protein CcmG, thiol:disulfide interchange protein DsbE